MTHRLRLAGRLMLVAVLLATLLALSVQLTFAAANDNNIEWDGLGHNSRDLTYRTPGGAVTAGTIVNLRLRAFKNDLTNVQARLWNDRVNQQSIVDFSKVATDATHDYWQYTLNTGALPTAYYYRFIVRDGSAVAYYDDSDQYGGWGAPSASADDFKSWQLTVYDPTFATPDWVKDAVIYQLFPDRFRDGSTANNTPGGTFFYEEAGGTISRSVGTDWNSAICDPRQTTGVQGCPGSYSRNFYGGDLQGVTDKLDYLEDLGVTAIYFTPIFEAPSNHKYDATDYSIIDDNLGVLNNDAASLALFQTLASEANARGINIILDGVFNHTSSDSHYFDRYDRYDDFDGACESVTSPFRNWYYFTPEAGGPCAGPADYESWFGYDSLPKLRANDAAVRDLIWDNGNESIAPYWMQWADGWRLDVGADVDPGTLNDPNNDYWEGFRAAVRATNPDTYIVGEEWGNGTSWFVGNEWDATMNYQYSSIMLSFWRDTTFVDNDHNTGSSAGELNPISPTVANERLLNWKERYPAETYYAQMNLLGSHDTSRALFMLEHGLPATPAELTVFPNNPAYDWSNALTRLRGVALMQMTLPGAPTIYYGDEIGLVGPQTWAGGKWEDDPYNRQPYPWLDETGTPFYSFLQTETPGSQRATMLAYYKTLTTARNAHPALRTGSLDPLLMQDFPADPLFVYGRRMQDGTDSAIVFINRSSTTQNITVNVAGYVGISATFDDALTPAVEVYTVAANGNLTANNVPASGGALLVLTYAPGPIPASVTNLAATAGQSQVTLNWSAAANANSYDIYRSILSGGGYALIGNTATTTYVDSTVTNSTRYYYVVKGKNTATGLVGVNSNEDDATPQLNLADAARILQFPFTLTHTISATDRTDNVYGQIYIAGATDTSAVVVPGIRAQIGYGATASTPNDSWSWFEMIPNPGYDFGQNNDEYQGDMLPTTVGVFDYTVRFSGDNGATWYYATVRAGGGSPIGVLTVNASGDTNDPVAPQNLAVTDTSSSSVSLEWDASVDTRRVGRAMFGYRIYRDETPGSAFVLIDEVPAAETAYTDANVTADTSYDYYVTAIDDSLNESLPSNTVTAVAEDLIVQVTFNVDVPAGTPPQAVHIAGNQDVWGPWNPGFAPLTQVDADTWTATFPFEAGTVLEYKFTRGSWETVEKAGDFSELPNRMLTVTGPGTQVQEHTIANWRDPHVIAYSPADGAVGVPVDAVVITTWSRDINTDATFSVTTGGNAVDGTFAWDAPSKTLTFTPSADLTDAVYDVVVSDVSGGGENQQYTTEFSFTVGGTVETPTPELTATAGVTATATATALPPTATSAPPTATATASPIELLLNSDFETDANADKLPDSWTGKNLTGDKQKCNKPEKVIANTGECAFQFKGGLGEISQLRQTVDLTAFTFATGDTLTLIGANYPKGTVNAKITLQAKYLDATEKTKVSLELATEAADYQSFTLSLVLASGSSNLGQIRVQISNKALAGKLLVDSFSLTNEGSARGTGLISLPQP
ncbi:MAG: alpha amylase N-terminal ig-like domain-containing protein [Armatimonadetes bacterium]|nr:alpha amylase N-terminal ig-like domain-containing protein [Anaerolineae bacterium]